MDEETQTLYAQPEDQGIRIDKWLAEQDGINLSRSGLQKLFEAGAVLVNDHAVHKNYLLSAHDVIFFTAPTPQSLDLTPENIPLTIVYEDDDLLVVDKPKGMVVHPAPGHPTGTLVHALLYHCGEHLSGINGVARPGIVHRIDRMTSGLLIAAKTDAAHKGLSEQIAAHSFTRAYQAVVMGHMAEKNGTICAPIGRSANDRKKMCVTQKNSKPAVTHYTVLAQYEKAAHLELRLETGRTHQIRVHMAYIGHPVLGDDVYGKPFRGIDGQCLHAYKIGFVHPVTSQYLEFESPLPPYFQSVLRTISRT